MKNFTSSIFIIIILLFFQFTVKSQIVKNYAPGPPAIQDPLYPYHPNNNVSFSSSNLPIVVINLDERMADKSEDRRVPADMTIVYRTDGSRNNITDTISLNHPNKDIINYTGKIGIKYRGNSSFNSSAKKPFGLKTQDENGKNKEVDILGMGADSDWALLAPYNDRSMIRDVLTFDLMKGFPDYVPTGIYCEVILNGVYEGIYIMTARVRRGDNRISLPKPGTSGNNLTGGYQLEIDRPDEPGAFYSQHNFRDLYDNIVPNKAHCFQHKYPEIDDFNDGMQTQLNYIRDLIYEFENATADNNFKDEETGYRKYIDPISVADFIIGQEIGRNVDGYRLSSPIYKYRDNKDPRFKLSFWDFNLAMGNSDYCDGWSTEGWQWNHNKFPTENERIPFWFKRILSDETFRKELRERWFEYRETNLSDESINHKIDSLKNLLTEAEVRNRTAWPIWNSSLWPNYYISRSWEEELNFLRDWLKKRISWMDSQLVPYSENLVANPSFDSDITRASNSSSIMMSNWRNSYSINNNTNNSNEIGLSSTVKLNGKYSLSFRASGEAWQTITELPHDKYCFRAWVRTVNDPLAELILRYHNTDPIIIPIEPSDNFYEIAIENIEVNTGIFEIAFKTNIKQTGETRLYVDSVYFYRQKDYSYHYHPEKKIDLVSSNLPIIVVDIDDSMPFNTAGANMTIINRANNERNKLSDMENPSNLINPEIINYHGKITLNLEDGISNKKSFSLTTKDQSNNSLSADLLDIGERQNWTLMSAYSDKSLLRNTVATTLIKDYIEHTVPSKHCELIINGIYQGVFILTAQITKDIENINLTMPGNTSADITGSYMLETGSKTNNSICSEHKNCDLLGNEYENHTYYNFIFPTANDYNNGMSSQKEYITEKIRQFENMMVSNDFTNTTSGYRKYIDTLSVMDYILYQEFVRNSDAYGNNMVIYKYNDNIDPRLKILNSGLLNQSGNLDYYDGWSSEGWVWNQNRFEMANMIPFWIKKLLSDEDFMDGLRNRWGYYRQNNFSDENITYIVDSLVNLLEESQKRNFRVYNDFGYHIFNNYFAGNSWEDENTYLKEFLLKRAKWMDSQLIPKPTNLIANASFDSDNSRTKSGSEIYLSNWTCSNNNIKLSNAVKLNGEYSLSFEDDGEAWQTLTELTDGKYTFKAWIYTVNDPVGSIIIRYHNSEKIIKEIDPKNEFQEIVINDIEVVNGICEVVFKTESGVDSKLYVDSVSFFLDWINYYPYHPKEQIALTSSNLPIIVVNVEKPMLSNIITTNMTIINHTDGSRNSLEDMDKSTNISNPNIINYNGKIELKTEDIITNKKSFSITTLDNQNNISSGNLLDMRGKSNWILTSLHNDKSLIRNALSASLTKDHAEYVPHGKHCELVINGIYQGVYVLTSELEKEIEKKMNFSSPALDITGSYALEIGGEKEGIRSNHKNQDLTGNTYKNYTYYNFLFPSSDQYNESNSQKNYITEKIHEFENIIMTDDFSNTTSGYRKYIDTLSLMDYILTQEFIRNADAYRKKMIIYKYCDNVDTRFKFLNNEFLNNAGNANYFDGWSSEGWIWNQNRFDTINMNPFWIKKILSDENFTDGLKKRWAKLRQNKFSNKNISNVIDSLTLLLNESQSRNYQIYDNLNYYIEPNYYAGTSWNEEVNYLKEFLLKRAMWMDSQLLTVPPDNVLANHSFDSDKSRGHYNEILLSSWMIKGKGKLSPDAADGNYSYNINENSYLHQTVTELMPGKYTFKAQIRTLNNSKATIYFKYHDLEKPILSYNVSPGNYFMEIEINNIPVSTGICEIGFETKDSPSLSFDIDKVYFYYTSPLDNNNTDIADLINPNKENYEVFPNPFSNNLTFSFIPKNNVCHITIYSLNGNIIDKFNVYGEKNTRENFNWTLERNIAPGIYFYKIENGNEQINGKLVKQFD